MIVADARNHRLQVQQSRSGNFQPLNCYVHNTFQLFSKKRDPIGVVKLDTALRRPSGVVFDDDLNQNPVLYVANLWDDSVYKFSLVKAM